MSGSANAGRRLTSVALRAEIQENEAQFTVIWRDLVLFGVRPKGSFLRIDAVIARIVPAPRAVHPGA
jgi:hypothetical protein